MGEARAHRALGRAVAELETLLLRLRAHHGAADGGAEMARTATRMRNIADPLGFDSLARVSGDVALLARRGDPVALAAVMARLDRVMQRTLKMVWDLRDLSG
ncbi:hypothetical protein OE856_06575 [Actibacterium sp. XHP0104]|nr:hypothetical protein [Actibacterium sp. XHP0104]